MKTRTKTAMVRGTNEIVTATHEGDGIWYDADGKAYMLRLSPELQKKIFYRIDCFDKK